MAGVIKSGLVQSCPETARAAAFNFEDLSQRAEQYLERVRQQAADILSGAQGQAEQLRTRAVEEGKQLAEQESDRRLQEMLDQRIETLLPALQQAAQQIEHSRQRWLEEWESRTVSLACAIAERVVRRELSRQPEISVQLLREALQLAMGGGQFTLRLNPDDHTTLGSWVERLERELGATVPSHVVADAEVSRGGCRLSTQFGTIDQTIEAQLARIEEELTDKE